MDVPSDGQPRIAATRSCTACRRRKIRCNRERPCNYCTKLRLECIYDAFGHAAVKPPPTDILAKLERIEASLQRIEAHTIPQNDRHSSVHSPACMSNNHTFCHQPVRDLSDSREDEIQSGDEGLSSAANGLWTETGKVMEVNRMDSDTFETETRSPPSTSSLDYHGLVFGVDTSQMDTSQLHPTEDRIWALWQVFIECVDPLIKTVHVPTTQRQLLQACQNLDGIPPAFESLMFAIYYAAVISMQSSVSHQTLSIAERKGFLQRYQTGLVRSLTKAGFMRAPDVMTLQALTMYLACARQVADKMYIWSMTGLLIRLAMKLDLHREPTTIGFRPFSSEMRRRLWWQIVVLDVRTAEESDMEPFIYEHVFDTKFPSNVNDSELHVDMVQPPANRQTRTEMAFTLTRLEISYAVRKLVFSPKFSIDNGYPRLSTPQKNEAVDSLLDDLKKRYFYDNDNKVPMCFLNGVAAEMVLAKLRLTINHPSRLESNSIPGERLKVLVQSAISVIHNAHRLRSDKKYARWVWLFQKYVEWDAVAFLLHSMNAVHMPDMDEEAWHAIHNFFEDWSGRVPAGEDRWERLQNLRTQAAKKHAVSVSTFRLGQPHSTETVDTEHGLAFGHPGLEQSQQQSQAINQNTMTSSHDAIGQDVQIIRGNVQGELGPWCPEDAEHWTYDGISNSSVPAVSGWEANVDKSIFGSLP